MPPHDLSLVEFGTVGGQIEQDSFVIDQPPIPYRFIDAVMDARFIEHDHARTVIFYRHQIVDKAGNGWVFDAAGMSGVD
ncbi:hypothetical protein WK39_22295 [Burkholderia cepacia]|nr:hypothetical protein WK39_22295 [Burkholderia cepacia]KVS74524.1 hypothetical protein WK40_36825 [Burkholderia cepacia]